MTIRFTPDGFSFADCPSSARVILDEAPFLDIDPGPDFQARLQESVLRHLCPPFNLVCQVVSNRVIILPPDVTDPAIAEQMYSMSVSASDTPEQILLQTVTLPTEHTVILCFGIDRSLYNFLQRNYDALTFEHHLSLLLIEGARMASGNCLVVRCGKGLLELALFRGQHLDVVNVYNTTQAENRSYYVMNTWKQLGLDQLRDHLLVLGQDNQGLQVRASLHRFIKHVYS